MIQFIKILFFDMFEKVLLLYGKIRFLPNKEYIKSSDEFHNLIGQYLRPGDVILMSEPGYISNVLIPGEYNHAAMYVGEGDIVHAYYPSVKIDFAFDALKRKNKIKVLRHNQLRNSPVGTKAATLAMTLVGVPYDMNFYQEKHTSPKLYCSELCFYVFQKLNIKVNINSEYILPDEFARCSDFITVLEWSSK